MGELIFTGLGLYNEKDVSLRGLEAAKNADFVFVELYTNLMPGLLLDNLERNIGKNVIVVSRRTLEDENGESILKKAENSKVVFMVPGDPLIATTHVDLRIRAHKLGIKTKIVHGASIVSASISASGLQNYRFGKSVTIPFPINDRISETPYNVIAENKMRNLHSLCFLDIMVEDWRYMTIREALETLLISERESNKHVLTLRSICVGLAKVGAEDEVVKAGEVDTLSSFNFGSPPHILIVTSDNLHFMEAEALVTLAGAPVWVREIVE
jgi:diphthine synthase